MAFKKVSLEEGNKTNIQYVSKKCVCTKQQLRGGNKSAVE